MNTVDEILASGRYRDRRGRAWEAAYYAPEWMHRVGGIFGERHLHLTPDQMRLLIERDQHRDECPGLAMCRAHPVPFVILWPLPTAIPAHSTIGKTHYTMGEALEEARRMAANE